MKKIRIVRYVMAITMLFAAHAFTLHAMEAAKPQQTREYLIKKYPAFADYFKENIRENVQIEVLQDKHTVGNAGNVTLEKEYFDCNSGTIQQRYFIITNTHTQAKYLFVKSGKDTNKINWNILNIAIANNRSDTEVIKEAKKHSLTFLAHDYSRLSHAYSSINRFIFSVIMNKKVMLSLCACGGLALMYWGWNRNNNFN